MKIAQLAPFGTRVSPHTGDKIEPNVSHSTDERVRQGHNAALLNYVGEINHTQNTEYLSDDADVTHSSLTQHKPFGLLMLESRATGMPVMGANLDSVVAEVIVQNSLGFFCQSSKEIAAVIPLDLEVNCQTCQENLKNKFRVTQMVNGDENVVNKIIPDHSDSNSCHGLAKI